MTRNLSARRTDILSVTIFCPPGAGFRRPARFWTPARRGANLSLLFSALRAQVFSVRRGWDACPAWASLSVTIFCPPGIGFRRPARLGRLPGVGLAYLILFSALWARGFAVRRGCDACPAWGICPVWIIFSNFSALRAWRIALRRSLGRLCGAQQGGAGYGAAPLQGPLCTPPGAPPKRTNCYHKDARARGSSCGSFLPSLRSVRRSPSAPRKCHSPLSP